MSRAADRIQREEPDLVSMVSPDGYSKPSQPGEVLALGYRSTGRFNEEEPARVQSDSILVGGAAGLTSPTSGQY